jgi:hypothetical protein
VPIAPEVRERRFFAVVHKDGVLDLLALLNSQHKSVNFTHEMERDGTLPLLFKIYRKPTNTTSGSSPTDPITPSITRWQHSPSNEHPDEERSASGRAELHLRDSTIKKLVIKHSERQRIRQVTTLTPLRHHHPVLS